MKKICVLLSLFLSMALSARTVEESCLFEKHIDKESGVVSYILKPGIGKDNSQCIYFTQKSMTNDGRFILCHMSENEFRNSDAVRKLYLIDLETEKVSCLEPRWYVVPCLDVENDVVYYPQRKNNVHGIFRINLKDPELKAEEICRLPEYLTNIGPVSRLCTHMWLTKDRTYMFCDVRIGDRFLQGRLNIKDGSFQYWGDTPFQINHGMINPYNKNLALAAHEHTWTDSTGFTHVWKYEKGKCPRLQLLTPTSRDTVLTVNDEGYHECWAADGKGFYYCGRGVFYYELRTKKTTQVAPPMTHADMTANLKYVVGDLPQGGEIQGPALEGDVL